jgi:hypothetical protein
MDEALIAVADAKYHYNFWRPISAIRNGDMDGNDATEREASWVPFIDTPMHPEYPSLCPLHPLGHGRHRVARGGRRWSHANVACHQPHSARDGAQLEHDGGVLGSG